MRFFFLGSSEFSKIVLEQLLRADLRPVLVITQEPKPQGRKQILSPTPVQILAEQNSIPFLAPENLKDGDFIQTLIDLRLDLAILTAYAKMIPPALLALPARGFFNLHPSLLPKWRGATPIQSAILAGDKKTGVTLFLIDERLDHGPIIATSKFEIRNLKFTYGELSKELAILGAKLIIETLPQWLENKITPQPQDESSATYCYRITSQDEKINWQTNAELIDHKVRALNPNPGVYALANEKIIKIIQGFPALDAEISAQKKTGEVFDYENKMAVKCQEGFYVVEILKPAGKIAMPSENFLRGNRWIIGKILI